MHSFVFIFMFLAAAGGFSPALLIAQLHTGPRIEIKDPSHDFDKVVDGAKPQHVFEIVNAGDETLVIQKVQPT